MPIETNELAGGLHGLDRLVPRHGPLLKALITGGATNRTGLSNAHCDNVIEQLAPGAKTREQRLRLMLEAETILLNQVSIIPIYTYNGKHLVHHSVIGASTNVLDRRNFKYIGLDDNINTRPGED